MSWLDEKHKYREEVLWWEICSILHDVGKLSDDFVKYRKTWQGEEQGWEKKDPHDQAWLNWQDPKSPDGPDGNIERAKDKLIQQFPGLEKFFHRRITTSELGAVSVVNAVHNHMKAQDCLTQLLKLGDGIDSIYDRNNPLIGCEQTERVFRSNVFGYESGRTEWQDGSLDRERYELYDELQKLLCGGRPIQDTYREIKQALRAAFRPGLSDTTRPNNDTDLWEHTYSVASITKALHVAELMGGHCKEKPFRIWGFGFDSLRYISYAHKIGDLLGRREVLDDLFDWGERLVGVDFAFGNVIYRDDSAVLFMVPNHDGTKTVLEELRRQIVEHAISAKGSDGEIVPSFAGGVYGTKDLTGIGQIIQELRVATQVPVTDGASLLAEKIRQSWKGKDGWSICSVCRRRPTRDMDDEAEVCGTCRERRRGRTESFELAGPTAQTPMIGEIADGHGRAVMIVAKFGLSKWLDGSMVRTNLITQKEAIQKTAEAVPRVKEFDHRHDADARTLAETQTWRQMLEGLAACRAVRDQEDVRASLYGRGVVGAPPQLNKAPQKSQQIWTETLAEFNAKRRPDLTENELLLNLVCAKTPTPSTTLDVWHTTERFLEGIGGDESNKLFPVITPLVPALKGFGARSRAWFQTNRKDPGTGRCETLKVVVDGKDFEVVYEGAEKRFWMVGKAGVPKSVAPGETVTLKRDTGEPVQCQIVASGSKENAYLPYRVISASPDLLLMIAPADKAVEITEAIYDRYLDEFGKAYGRLPLSIGHIFFAQHQPMFGVLDAARRMEEQFRVSHEAEPKSRDLPVPVERLPSTLGDGTPDWHHPYTLTAEPMRDAESYFKTNEGDMVLFKDLNGAKVKMYPNHFRCLYLGASAHRFRETPPSEKDWVVEDLFRMREIWNTLRQSKVTDAGLRKFEAAVRGRKDAWGEKAEGAVRALAESLAAEWPKDVRELVADRLFFPALTFYWRILKERLKGEEN